MDTSDSEKLAFERNITAGLSQSTLLQRYWHAHWIKANCKPDLSDRADIEAGLAKLCADVWQGRLRSSSGFASDWFEALIRPEIGKLVPQNGKSDDVVLRSAYEGREQRH